MLLDISLKNSEFLALKTKVLKYIAEGNFHKLNMNYQTIMEGSKTGKLCTLLKAKMADIN